MFKNKYIFIAVLCCGMLTYTVYNLRYDTLNNVFIASSRFIKNMKMISPEHIETQNKQKNLTQCPRTPPNLIGEFAFHHFNGKLSEIEAMFEDPYKPGGRYKPENCIALQKLAIIIAYRDRKKHLLNFLYNVIPMLRRQQLDFTIFVIEQGGTETFNRGLLMNVGIKESLKIDNFDCFIFHDVDMYPIHDYNLYRCEDDPKHMAVGLQKSGYRLSFSGYFGGITAYKKKHVEKTNGFANSFFGWGGEDGDQRNRLGHVGLTYVRYPVIYARYATPNHRRDKTNPTNPDRFTYLQNTKKRMFYDGLNSAVYNITSINYLKLYTNITVTFNKEAVFKKINETKIVVEEQQRIANEKKRANMKILKQQDQKQKTKTKKPPKTITENEPKLNGKTSQKHKANTTTKIV